MTCFIRNITIPKRGNAAAEEKRVKNVVLGAFAKYGLKILGIENGGDCFLAEKFVKAPSLNKPPVTDPLPVIRFM